MVFRIVIGIFHKPKETGRLITENRKLAYGYIIGLLSICSVPIGSWVSRIIMKSYPEENVLLNMINIFFMSLVFYLIDVTVTFGLCKIFKGKGNLINLASHIGWTFFPLFLTTLTLTPITAINLFNRQNPSIFYNYFVILLIFLFFAELAIMFILFINVISNAMVLSKKKSIMIALIQLVPLFVVFDIFF